MIKKILVPTDFSGFAETALEEAVRLAKAENAELVLLHVVEETDYPVGHVLKSQGFPNLEEEIHKRAKEQMAELEPRLGGVKAQHLVVDGIPSAEIADAALDNDVDLIVMASHGITGFKRFLLGSTTERVIRIAPCSVLVVRKPEA